MENKEELPVRFTIDNIGDFDALRIYVRMGKDGVRYKIGIEGWLQGYLSKYDDERKDLIDGLIDGINKAIDEVKVNGE